MELNDAQTIVDLEGDLRDLLIRCQLDHGCHVIKGRRVRFCAQ
jgi:hypothetical protein